MPFALIITYVEAIFQLDGPFWPNMTIKFYISSILTILELQGKPLSPFWFISGFLKVEFQTSHSPTWLRWFSVRDKLRAFSHMTLKTFSICLWICNAHGKSCILNYIDQLVQLSCLGSLSHCSTLCPLTCTHTKRIFWWSNNLFQKVRYMCVCRLPFASFESKLIILPNSWETGEHLWN